jgi:hypothetical protein
MLKRWKSYHSWLKIMCSQGTTKSFGMSWFIYLFVCLFIAVLEFELRASYLVHSHLSYVCSPFHFIILWIGSMFLPGVGLRSWFSHLHLQHTCIRSLCHHTWLLDWVGDLANFLPGLALNLDSPNLCLLGRRSTAWAIPPVLISAFWIAGINSWVTHCT